MSFTKRQLSLFNRLQKICDKIDLVILPKKIERIEVFGSAIRGKPNPGDLDITIIYSENEKFSFHYDKLREVILKINQYDNSNVKETVTDYVKKNYDKKISKVLIPIFSKWLDKFSWDNLYYGILSWDQIIRKVLLERSKEIHIAEFIELGKKSNLITKTTELAWDRNNPNVLLNMKHILSPSILKKNLLKEIENLDIQLRQYKKSIRIIKKVFNFIYNSKRLDLKKENSHEWIDKKALEIFPKESKEHMKELLHNRTFEDVKFQITFNKEKYKKISQMELSRIVEKTRSKLSDTRKRQMVYQRSLFYLGNWLENLKENKSIVKSWTKNTWICTNVLKYIPKTAISENEIRKFLRELNLQENKVIADRSSGRVDYRPENLNS